MTNVVKLEAWQALVDNKLAACEDRLLELHREALLGICTSLVRHVACHRHALALLTDSQRKQEAVGLLGVIEMTTEYLQDRLSEAQP